MKIIDSLDFNHIIIMGQGVFLFEFLSVTEITFFKELMKR